MCFEFKSVSFKICSEHFRNEFLVKVCVKFKSIKSVLNFWTLKNGKKVRLYVHCAVSKNRLIYEIIDAKWANESIWKSLNKANCIWTFYNVNFLTEWVYWHKLYCTVNLTMYRTEVGVQVVNENSRFIRFDHQWWEHLP